MEPSKRSAGGSPGVKGTVYSESPLSDKLMGGDRTQLRAAYHEEVKKKYFVNKGVKTVLGCSNHLILLIEELTSLGDLTKKTKSAITQLAMSLPEGEEEGNSNGNSGDGSGSSTAGKSNSGNKSSGGNNSGNSIGDRNSTENNTAGEEENLFPPEPLLTGPDKFYAEIAQAGKRNNQSVMTYPLWKLLTPREQAMYLAGVSDSLSSVTKGTVQVFKDLEDVSSAVRQRQAGSNLESVAKLDKLALALLLLQEQYWGSKRSGAGNTAGVTEVQQGDKQQGDKQQDHEESGGDDGNKNDGNKNDGNKNSNTDPVKPPADLSLVMQPEFFPPSRVLKNALFRGFELGPKSFPHP
jgi:hypothetical protein